ELITILSRPQAEQVPKALSNDAESARALVIRETACPRSRLRPAARQPLQYAFPRLPSKTLATRSTASMVSPLSQPPPPNLYLSIRLRCDISITSVHSRFHSEYHLACECLGPRA